MILGPAECICGTHNEAMCRLQKVCHDNLSNYFAEIPDF